MANISRKEHCGGCAEKKPLRSANQVITSKTLLPCSFGTNKLITGEIANNNFDGDLTLVTANTELITVDTDYFNFIDVPLDPCGGKLKVKGHSHITLSDELKEKLEILGATGSIEKKIRDLYNSEDFRYFMGKYITRLVEDRILESLGTTVVNNTQQLTEVEKQAIITEAVSRAMNQLIPLIPSNTGSTFSCNMLNTCPEFTSLKQDVANLKLQIPALQNRITQLENLVAELINRLNNQPTSTPSLLDITKNVPAGTTKVNPITLNDLLGAYISNGTSNIQYIEIVGNTTNLNRPSNPIHINDLNQIVYTGTEDYTFNIVGINQDNQKTNMAQIKIIFEKVADTFERCIKMTVPSGATPTYNIIRDTQTNAQFGSLTFTNSCGTSYTIPEQVLILENGIKVYIPSFVLPGNTSVTKQFIVEGAYTGSKNTITGSVNVNGVIASAILNVSNRDSAPVAQDVTKTFDNRFPDGTITQSDLVWSDVDGDTLQAVRFTGDVSMLFTNSDRTTAYVAGTELEPNFTLFIKHPDQDAKAEFALQYNVKAGDKWSN